MEMSGVWLPVHRPTEHTTVSIENGIGASGTSVDSDGRGGGLVGDDADLSVSSHDIQPVAGASGGAWTSIA